MHLSGKNVLHYHKKTQKLVDQFIFEHIILPVHEEHFVFICTLYIRTFFYQQCCVESKVLQYFVSMSHNLADPDAFAKVMKKMNHTGQWDAEHAWYSQNVTHWICLNDLEYRIGIHSFWSNWPCLLVKVLANYVKFLEQFGSTAPSPFPQQMAQSSGAVEYTDCFSAEK